MSEIIRPVVSHLLFIDTETTGVSEGYHEVIEIGAILVDRASRLEKARASFRQRIRFIDRANPEAMAINGIDLTAWNKDAPEDGIQQFQQWVATMLKQHLDLDRQRACLAGWNTMFDANMLALHSYDAVNLRRFPGMDYHVYDVYSTAQDVLGPDACKLSVAARMLGVPTSTHHAMQDAETTFLAWRELQQRVRLDISVGR